MKLWFCVFIMSVLLGCRPQEEATSYGVNKQPLAGPNQNYQTIKNIAIIIDYALEDQAEATNLQLILLQGPKYGTLDKCDKSNPLVFSCEYMPSLNFVGKDEIILVAKDGDFAAKSSTILTIDVLAYNENAPKVGPDQIETTDQGVSVSFNINPAVDKDNDANLLTYIVVDKPKFGELENCFLGVGVLSCTYNPNDLFNGSDSFTYRVKDPDGNFSDTVAKVTIIVKGKIIPDHVQTFTVTDKKQIGSVDITWVVDNSQSMEDDQARLAQNFASFINNFLDPDPQDPKNDCKRKSRFPFSMAVTTTMARRYYDINQSVTDQYIKFEGPRAGEVYYLGSDLAESDFCTFRNNFTAAVNVIANKSNDYGILGLDSSFGDNNEKALLSIYNVYKKFGPNSATPWYGGNDRLNVYVILSDEMEQSHTTGQDGEGAQIKSSDGSIIFTHDVWINTILAFKDNPAKTRIYPIVDPDNDHGVLFGDKGRTYQKIAEKTGGKTYDIKSNFDTVLDDISKSVIDIYDSFLLDGTKNIQENSIKVKITLDGQDVTSQYTWSYAQYAIKFGQALPIGAVVEVTYDYMTIYRK